MPRSVLMIITSTTVIMINILNRRSGCSSDEAVRTFETIKE